MTATSLESFRSLEELNDFVLYCSLDGVRVVDVFQDGDWYCVAFTYTV